MLKVTSIERFETSFGICFIIEAVDNIRIDQIIIVDNQVYRIKKIQMQSTPSENEQIAIFV